MIFEKTLSSKSVFTGRVVGLKVDQIELENGVQSIREVVTHRPALAIVPLDDDSNVILVKQYRYPIGSLLLEVPAGIIEDDESPIECAQRELQEEIGYRAGDLKILSEFWTAPGFSNELMYGYLARDLTKSSLPADYDENIEIIRIPFDDILTLISRGEIKDAKTIATLLMASSLK